MDRAALDVARALGIDCGGWCPQGRIAEDGAIAKHYGMDETPSDDYSQRTRWNVRDSDGTLILTQGLPAGGTAYSLEIAWKLGKPVTVIDPQAATAQADARAWLEKESITVLNVCGPRESNHPGAYAEAKRFLETLLSEAT